MVEGPGCKLNGEKLKKRVKGQIVNGVSGNIIEKRTKAEKQVLESPYEKLIGKRLLDVKTLGKELFAIFEDDLCLRIHFLMSGSVRFNNEPREFGDGKAAEPRLRLHMSRDEVGFFDSAVELRSAAECIEKHSQLIDLDICSPSFDAKRAAQTITDHPERLVCDVILDQLVLPGVGNIIKNEALFDAGINPNSKVKELSPDLISHLVKMNRDFTNIFYKCRKEGKNLQKHMKVYKKANCAECGNKITRCKIGEYERLTFFCLVCQTNTMRTAKKKLATRNSLLGWVEASKNQVPWNCSVCTLENKPANTKCSACLTPRNTSPDTSLTNTPTRGLSVTAQSPSDLAESPKFSSPQVRPPSESFSQSKPALSSGGSWLKSSADTSRKHPLENTPEDTCRIGKYKFRKITQSPQAAATPPSQTQLGSLCSPVSRPKFQDINPRMTDLKMKQGFSVSKQMPDGSSKKPNDQILCSGHKKPAKKSVVEKRNENQGRVFYVCNMPQIKQCKFFMWGDDHHPLCCHGRTSVVRTVMKLNANNGREFYCCPMPKGKQCDFFEWVDRKV